MVLPPEVHQKIDKARQNLTAGGVPNMVTNRILEFIRSAPEEDLVRIRLKPLAREWSLKERDLLGGFLLATREGLFNLTWDVICPHCRGVREEIGSLGRLPRRGHCAVCRVDFDATAANALEVTFHANPSIRKVEKRLFCAAEPATKPHIRIQKTLKPGDEISLPTLLSDGRYRMRIQGSMDYNLLDLENQWEETNVVWPDTLAQESLKARHFPTVVLRNTAAEAKTFVLEENRQDLDTLRPVDLFTFQGFRDLFSQEALAADLKLEIGVQTILFTDLVGSTQFYEKEGDTVAFTEVRQHFLRTYEAVKAHDGAVVKTIGDAVMAAFVRPLDALKAAVEMQKYFNGHNPATRLRLRITLNTGSCLAVNLNSNIDYFGNTVNLAAKIQAIAGAGQIGFTPAVLEDDEAAAYLKGLGLAVEQVEFETKWSKKTIPLFRVEVK